jgi:SAM-dependent methyltransferase
MPQLRIAELDEGASEAELNAIFSKFGAVSSVVIVRDIVTGKTRGFAMVKMPDSAEADRAIKGLNGTMFRGRQVDVGRMPETLPGEMEFREWLVGNAGDALKTVGIRPGQTVLDYGCGPGIFTIPCAQIVGAGGKVYALEVRPEVLRKVSEKIKRENIANVEPILGDKASLATGLGDRSMDVVLVYDVMHAIDDKSALLQELHRVLKKGGLLSIFPMHLGTKKMLSVMKGSPLFRFRDSYSLGGYKSPTEVLNFVGR